MSEQTKKKKKNKPGYQTWLVPGVIGLFFLVVIGFIIKIVMTDLAPRSKEQLQSVTLLKPPPEVKEKPPEPEVPKDVPKQEVIQDIPQPQDTPQNDQPQDDTPAGSDLGVEGEGGAGGDAFGLVGKGKKGHDITLGGGGGGNRLSLMAKYGWYTQKIQEEIKKEVKKKLDLDGGIPKGKFQTVVKITLDARGNILKRQIVGGSGNSKMDDAVLATLGEIRVSEPPTGMPSVMTLKISSQG
ncbi:MAG TPA: TonB C-terminal domain-containing protein [Geobacteraceae bacterium]|nr:TonB C-terminal domain-containing protein [Geobacteraceae bacterium]